MILLPTLCRRHYKNKKKSKQKILKLCTRENRHREKNQKQKQKQKIPTCTARLSVVDPSSWTVPTGAPASRVGARALGITIAVVRLALVHICNGESYYQCVVQLALQQMNT